MVVKYICDRNQDNIVEVIESCNYFNSFLYRVYLKSIYSANYTYHEFIHILCNAVVDVDNIIISECKYYPLLYDFYYKKSPTHLTLVEFIKDDIPLLHMDYLDNLVRLNKIKTLLKTQF